MNAFVPKEEIAILRPNTLSHYFKDDAMWAPAPEKKRLGLFGRVAGLLRAIAELPRRQAVMNELNMLSDHELSDIGLVRGELSRVFDSGFVAQRNSERYAARAAVNS
ncbi:MAG TPA: DUF1127 domain-containing protein [Acetobacteraceae bacterium]|jgi:uncharacterized protein YjiS (DUF1127 family)